MTAISSESLNHTWQADLTRMLHQELLDLREKNSRYSLRAYSKKLGVSAATLSLIIRGKQNWNLTADLAKQIVLRTNRPMSEKRKIIAKMGLTLPREQKRLTPELSKVLMDSFYTPVLVAHGLPGHERKPDKLAERFALPVQEVHEAIDVLKDAGLLVADPETGSMEHQSIDWVGGDGPSNEEVLRFHNRGLDLARGALTTLPSKERDFTQLTFTGNSQCLEDVRKEIRNFYERIRVLMSSQVESDEVFHMSVQLFPVRQIPGEDRS